MGIGFSLEHSGFTGYLGRNEIGQTINKTDGTAQNFFSRSLFWPVVPGYERVYKTYPKKSNESLYASPSEDDCVIQRMGKNAARNSLLYVRTGTDFQFFLSPYKSNGDWNWDDRLYAEFNIDAGMRVPVRFIEDKKTPHKKIEYNTRTLEYFGSECSTDYNLLARSNTFVNDNNPPMPECTKNDEMTHGFARAKYIKERGVITVEYSTIDIKETENNPFPGIIGYVEGKTHKNEHIEIYQDLREEYASLVDKLKQAGIEDPDAFIKDYTNYYKSFTLSNQEYDLMQNIKQNPNTDNEENFMRTKHDQYSEDPCYESNHYENGIAEESMPNEEFSCEDTGEKGTITKCAPSKEEYLREIFGERRNYIKEKYNIDICDLDISKKEYYVLTNANKIYEYSPEEIEEIQKNRKILSNKIFRQYKEEVKKVQNDNPEYLKYRLKDGMEDINNEIENILIDIKNSQLTGTPYIDLNAGLDFKFCPCNSSYDSGNLYAGLGVGYANDYFDISAGYKFKTKSNVEIEHGNIVKDDSSPYVKLGFNYKSITGQVLFVFNCFLSLFSGVFFGYPKETKAPGEPQNDFDRLSRAQFNVTYEPANQKLMFGIDLHIPAEPHLH